MLQESEPACRQQQDLLLLAPDLLARRLVELKLTVPKADVGQLVQLGPWLLLLDVRSCCSMLDVHTHTADTNAFSEVS